MKKVKKLLAGLLACVCVSASAVALTGCSVEDIQAAIEQIFDGGGLNINITPNESANGESSDKTSDSSVDDSSENKEELRTPSEGLAFTFSEDGTYAILSGIGTCTDTDIVIPDTYEGKAVASIGMAAFANDSNLKSVVIPNSITSIGMVAFGNCQSLENIEVSKNNPNYCDIDGNLYSKDKTTLIQYAIGKKATEFVVPDSVISVADYAIAGCMNLTSMVIGDSVENIGENALLVMLTNIEVSENNENYCDIDGNLYNKDETTLIRYPMGKIATEFVVPDSVTSIGVGAFFCCESLTSVIIGDNVRNIGKQAFASCFGLASIVIPDSVTSIGESAFADCSSLTLYCETKSKPSGWADWIGGDNILTIVWDCNNNDVADNGYIYTVVEGVRYALKDGEAMVAEQSINIVTAHILSSVTYKNIEYPVTSIGDQAFECCRNLTSVVIPDSLTSIGNSAFGYCDSLTSLEIPDSVTSIGGAVFIGCENLTSVEIPDSVTNIEHMVFWDCTNLTSVVIGDSVMSIGDGAFYNCSSLTSVYYKGTAEEWNKISIDISDNSFSDNSYLTNATRYYYSETEPTVDGNWWHYVDGVVTVWE